jgi:glycosyltransferase involved in cell wall biosynthesis
LVAPVPEISIVMGVYNGASTVRETITSLLSQQECDIEVIAVDDGSTDGTSRLLHEFAQQDGRLRIVNKRNEGLTRALITGCQAARGVYIARQDAGDVSLPRRVTIQREMLRANPKVTFTSCATQYAGPEMEPLWVAHPTGKALSAARVIDLGLPSALADGPTHHGSVMFRRDTYDRVGGYRQEFYYGQDFDLWFRLAQAGLFQTVDEILYIARITPGSLSAQARSKQQRLAAISRAALALRLRGQADSELLKRALRVRPSAQSGVRGRAQGLYFIGETLRRNGHPKARQYLRRAMLSWPFSPRAWVRYAQTIRF